VLINVSLSVIVIDTYAQHLSVPHFRESVRTHDVTYRSFTHSSQQSQGPGYSYSTITVEKAVSNERKGFQKN